MNNLTLFVIISIFVIICLAKLYIVYCKNKLEHLSVSSDEAIQNLASLYNTDQLTIGKLNVTDTVTAGPLTSAKLIDLSLGDTVKNYIDSKIATHTAQIAATNAALAAQTGRIDWLANNSVIRTTPYTMRFTGLTYSGNGGGNTGQVQMGGGYALYGHDDANAVAGVTSWSTGAKFSFQ